MGEASARLGEALRQRKQAEKEKADEEALERVPDNMSEQGARRAIIRETEQHGATLEKPDAKGGLPASLVLHTFRKAKYRCTRCGKKDKIGPHHIGGVVASPKLSRLGHQNKPGNLTILCAKCHDAVHENARAEGVDSSQVLPKADKGTDRDKGDRPVAPG